MGDYGVGASAGSSPTSTRINVQDLPTYLQNIVSPSTGTGTGSVQVLDLPEIINSNNSNNSNSLKTKTETETKEQQTRELFLLRHCITQAMAAATDTEGEEQVEVKLKLKPELILDRAWCHYHLGYPELAVADAYAAYMLASGEAEDLVELAVSKEGEGWDVEGSLAERVQADSVRVLVRGLRRLGARVDADRWARVLGSGEEEEEEQEDDDDDDDREGLEGIRGRCQRVVYPWNDHEPDRMSAAALAEINSRLSQASEGMLECRKTILPLLAGTGTGAGENAQLGLFATRDLKGSSSASSSKSAILRERSCLTAIRPHDAALCDCCAMDLELNSDQGKAQVCCCPGCPTTTLFCSKECLDLAGRSYHRPFSTFCAGSASGAGGEQDDDDDDEDDDEDEDSLATFTTLGRAESSTTPEWDLYFLLVVRCMQMAITQNVHPLDLFEVKYLWGDFDPFTLTSAGPGTGTGTGTGGDQRKRLPFSFHHHVSLPFQLFETLSRFHHHGRPPLDQGQGQLQPYSGQWLDRFDFWTINTLYAKFRGVATANQSTFDGKAESAAVHALWCLANHSCAPNVGWASAGGGGVRVLRVSEGGEIARGQEIWSHYTDVDEPDVAVRRARLREVLGGGMCMCRRCVREAGKENEKEQEESAAGNNK